MLQLARQEFPSLKIDDRETRRDGPSYMVDTLQEMRAAMGTSPFCYWSGRTLPICFTPGINGSVCLSLPIS